MDICEFAIKVRDGLPEYLSQLEPVSIKVDTIVKNNGVLRIGLCLHTKDNKLTPCIYLNKYYLRYKNGTDFEDILSDIGDEYINAYNSFLGEDKPFPGLDMLRENVYLSLINYEANEAMLRDVPYIRFHDMAVTFRLIAKTFEDGNASSLIRNTEAGILNMTADELYKLARDNMQRLMPVKFFALKEKQGGVAADMVDIDYDSCKDIIGSRLYVITNKQMIGGASYIVFQDLLEDCKLFIGESFYIIPSSIHEVILLPESMMTDMDSLKTLHRSIIRDVVDETEYLSDNIYYYNPDKKIIEICG